MADRQFLDEIQGALRPTEGQRYRTMPSALDPIRSSRKRLLSYRPHTKDETVLKRAKSFLAAGRLLLLTPLPAEHAVWLEESVYGVSNAIQGYNERLSERYRSSSVASSPSGWQLVN